MSELFEASAHTAHHGKDENGRSEEIESYIRKSVDFAVQAYMDNMDMNDVPLSTLKDREFIVLDMGCDYGYALTYASYELSRFIRDPTLIGIDPYYVHNPFGLNIYREPMDDTSGLAKKIGLADKKADIIILNHSLEHVSDPHKVAENIASFCNKETVVFIAVPDAQSDWSRWDGHYTLWTKDWLRHFMSLHGFVPVKPVELRCFRSDNVEIWGTFRLRNE